MDVGDLLAKASDSLSVRRAFGAAYEKDGVLIIPVAMVAGGGGAGTARTRRVEPAVRPDSDTTAHDVTPEGSGPMDVGGGFGGLVMPAGVYVVRGEQVRWVPEVNVTVAVLASLSLVRFLARTWMRRRRRHAHR